ncbi:MAG: PepSY-associated TM helix domain-containing protein [Chromatocurvus sp.]
MAIRRRIFFDLHSWAGLKVSLFMFFIAFTGTLAVFAHDIDWLITPEMRVDVADSRVSFGELLDAARTRYPDWTPFYLSEPFEPWFASELIALTPDGERRRIYLDPYRGEVTGDVNWFNAHRILRETHRHLMLPAKIGVPVVSLLAIPLMISIITSFWIYKRWWKGFFKRPRSGRRRRFWGDLHRLTGVWSFAFLFIIALTSLWYLVESLGGHAPPAANMPGGDAERPPAEINGAQLDAMIEKAQHHFPGLDIDNIRFPLNHGQAVALLGQTDVMLVRPRANAIAFDAADGEEVHRNYAGDLSIHQRISEAADPLHFGTFGGLTTRLLWFIFGLGMSALSLTGIYLYGLRLVNSDAPHRAERMARKFPATA